MVFGDLFGNKKNSEDVSDEQIMKAIEISYSSLDLQIRKAREMSLSFPDGDSRFDILMGSNYFFGYVVGLVNGLTKSPFEVLVEEDNLQKNIARVIQSVVANIYFQEREPDWNSVFIWEAKSGALENAEDQEYLFGKSAGNSFSSEIESGNSSLSNSLLGSHMLLIKLDASKV